MHASILFFEYMKNHFIDTCLDHNFPCLRMVHSEMRSAFRVQLACQANVVKCDDFCSNRTQSPFAFLWVQLPPVLPNWAEGKSFPSSGHQGKFSSMTMPGAVFLTSRLGSLAVVLQIQCMQVPEQIGGVPFKKMKDV